MAKPISNRAVVQPLPLQWNQVLDQAGEPSDGLGVLFQVQHELLAAAGASQAGVLSVPFPAFGVGVIGERFPVPLGEICLRLSTQWHSGFRYREPGFILHVVKLQSALKCICGNYL